MASIWHPYGISIPWMVGCHCPSSSSPLSAAWTHRRSLPGAAALRRRSVRLPSLLAPRGAHLPDGWTWWIYDGYMIYIYYIYMCMYDYICIYYVWYYMCVWYIYIYINGCMAWEMFTIGCTYFNCRCSLVFMDIETSKQWWLNGGWDVVG